MRGEAHHQLSQDTEAAADLHAAWVLRRQDKRVEPASDRLLAAVHTTVGRFDDCADVLATVLPPTDEDAVARATCLRATARTATAHDVLAAHHSPAARLLRVRMLVEDGAPAAAHDDVTAIAATASFATLRTLVTLFAPVDRRFASTVAEVALARFANEPEAARDLARLLTVPSRAVTNRRVIQDADSTDGGAASRAALLQTLHETDHPGLQRMLAATIDERLRLRSRLAALVDDGAFDEVLALRERVAAQGFFNDDNVRYAIAFAACATGDDVLADDTLDDIAEPAVFERATALRAAVAACRTTEQPCRR